MKRIFLSIFQSNAGANILSVIGGIIYLVQSWVYIHTLDSLLDEGNYLYKGYLFATGQYRPFQPYGPWTNKTPLAFLIPGYIQSWFGPGLRTGRYFMIVIGGLMLIGLWLVARRLGGYWWATAAVWTVTLNPWLIKTYSLAVTQGLAVCVLVWILTFVVGEDIPLWWVTIGSLLAGVLVLIRQNMLPVPFLIVGYVIWQRGWRTGVLSALSSIIVLVVGHSFYWPEILAIWTPWIPFPLPDFFESWRLTSEKIGLPFWSSQPGGMPRLISFFWGLRYHFISISGAIFSWLLWPSRRSWRSEHKFRVAVLLSLLFGILFLMHAVASLALDYCVFCFANYLAFFSVVGVLLLVVSVPSWLCVSKLWRQRAVFAAVLFLTIGVSFGLYFHYFQNIVTFEFVHHILVKEVPRIKGVKFQSGTIPLWGLIVNIFKLDYESTHIVTRKILVIALSVVTGVIIGGAIIMIAKVLEVTRLYKGDFSGDNLSLGLCVLACFFVIGMVLSPTFVLGGDRYEYDCGGDVLASYERAGRELQKRITPGELIYWQGGNPPVVFLYMPGVKIFPPQLNGSFSYRIGGNPETLYRFGRWNESLAHQWAQKADYILIGESVFGGWLADYVSSNEFDELLPTPQVSPCREESRIHVYRRLP